MNSDTTLFLLFIVVFGILIYELIKFLGGSSGKKG